MLTQIRHIQKGVLVFVTVIIVVSFAFFYSDFDFVEGTLGRQDCVVKVYNRCYRQKEFQKLASHFDVSLELGMYDFAMVLFGENRMDRDPTDFVMSLVILRREAEKLGIEPSAEEIKAAIPSLPIFQQPWVTAEIVENRILGPNGFTQGDLAQLVKDYLSFQKMRDLVSAGVAAVPSEAAKLYTRNHQRYTATVLRFDRNAEAEAVKVTDEDVKKYYEENQDDLKSEPKRGFDYVKFIPKPVAEDATNEVKAKANLAFANAVNRAYADLAGDQSNFPNLAKQYVGEKADFTAESGNLEPFARTEAPEMLKGNEEALGAIFSGAKQAGEVSVPIQTDGGAYFVFHFSKSVEPAPLTLEQATSAIKEVLTSTKSNRAANDAASAAHAKLSEAIKAGKSFADAAKDLGLKTETLPSFSQAEPLADRPDAAAIATAVGGLRAGELSAVSERPAGEGYFVAHVDKLEIYKDAEAQAKKDALLASIKNQTDRTLFTSWFNQRRSESGSERPMIGNQQP